MTKRLIRVYVDEERKDLIEFIELLPEISSGIVEIIDKVRSGELVSLRDSIDYKIKERRYDKLAKEMLRLDIDNRIRLIREMKLSPSEVIEITSGRKDLQVDSIPDTRAGNLSPSQWDWVYGSLSYGYKKDNEKKTCVCGFDCEKDETLRKHIMDTHSLEVTTQLKELERFGIK